MLESLELKGFWWLPDLPGKKLPGTLTFSQNEGAILEVVGIFGTKRKYFEQPPIILGEIQNGEPVTLYHCSAIQWTYPLMGMGGARYRGEFLFKGTHFQKEEDIRFGKLFGSYTDLDAWVGISGFTIKDDFSENQYSVEIQYSKPKSQYIEINDRFEVGIEFSSHGPSITIIQTEAKIIQQAYLMVNSKAGDLPFDEIFSLLNRFSYFLQIGIQRIAYPIEIIGFTEANKKVVDEEKPFYPKVNIYYEPIEGYIERAPLIPQFMLFTFKDLDESNIIKWFTNFDKYETVIHLYRSLFYNNRLFINNRFLNIAQALESLHSILFDNSNMPESEFIRRRTELLESAPVELKEWTREILNNANYKRYKTKILELLEEKKRLLSKCIIDNDRFAARVRDTRNEFVHHNAGKLTFRDKEELLSAIYLLTYLFESYVFEIIGFSDEKTAGLFAPRMDRYLSRWKKL